MSSDHRIVTAAVIIAALGYFVDIYDLILFSIVRVQSLTELGVPAEESLDTGLLLLNWQMAGMLIGGLVWGVLGDKQGRLSILFGSILMYSLANLANGMVQSVEQYKWLRLIAGIGLAGELGGGITLVSEVMKKESRGYGTMIVAVVGLTGAIVAFGVSEAFDWRTAYFVGGFMGLALLLLRVSVTESGMFRNAVASGLKRGNFFMLFNNRDRFSRYLTCLLIGLPTWFVMGILVQGAPEFGKAVGMLNPLPRGGPAVMWAYVGLIAGDIISGILSQLLRSRKKVMWIFHSLSVLSVIYYLLPGDYSMEWQQFKCFLLGLGVGYWAIFVTIGAEQFGVNLRATVATTVPNFARGSLMLITLLFNYLRSHSDLITAAAATGAICAGIAFVAVYYLRESFGKDLDYAEH